MTLAQLEAVKIPVRWIKVQGTLVTVQAPSWESAQKWAEYLGDIAQTVNVCKPPAIRATPGWTVTAITN